MTLLLWLSACSVSFVLGFVLAAVLAAGRCADIMAYYSARMFEARKYAADQTARADAAERELFRESCEEELR